MVTGDRADAAETIAAALDIDAVLSDRVPSDKVDAVAMERRLHPTLMVGDGINDAPALAAADVGVALGARGASASSEAADVVILVDRLDRVSEAVTIARRARGIAIQSIVAGMLLSGIGMGFAAFGWLTPVAGALTQEAIDVAVILNALRALGPGRRVSSRSLPDKFGARSRPGAQTARARAGRAEVHLGWARRRHWATGGRLDPQRAPHCGRKRRHARAPGRSDSISASDEDAGRRPRSIGDESCPPGDPASGKTSWLGWPMVYAQRMRTSTLCATPSV